MNPGQALEMLEAARRNGRHLASCDTRLIGTPASNEVARLLSLETFGQVYHVTFMNRGQRRRTGIEYQPETRWFLNKDINGGGALMDWGPYDIALLDRLFDPSRVAVLSAWLATPETNVDLPPGIILDTEQHIGATLRFSSHTDAVFDVSYERAACTHGEPRTIVEVEGTKGAVSWEWIDWSGDGAVRVTEDRGGQPATSIALHPPRGGLEAHDRPLQYFVDYLRGGNQNAVIDGRSVFNFLVLQAIYTCARTGVPQTVTREGL
jgi:predicted dehydrogenase